MTSVIEKRLSIHKQLESQQQENGLLRSQITHLQALANIGTATSMIAHEINNLLTPLTSYADLALQNPHDQALAHKALKKTLQNSQRASKIAQSILALATGHNQQYENASLCTLVQEVFDGLGRDFARDGITVNVQIPHDLTVWAVPVQIQQLLMNLILNARDAMSASGGRLDIRACDRSDTVEIEVADTGRGIGPDDLKEIFKPFYTAKVDKNSLSHNRSCGLGLAFCKRITDAHRGSILVESQPAHGTTFRIKLPKPQ